MSSNEEFYKEQSKQFDKAADYYDRFRPSYPKELVDCIVDYTEIWEGSKILEIGAGSGKATELFVNNGFDMYCVEPGRSLATVGTDRFKDTGRVRYHVGRFEEWEVQPEHFDLAISAQAFHWVPKPVGYQKCAEALKQDGHIGLFWNLYLSNNDPVDEELSKTNMLLLNTQEECEQRISMVVEEIRSSGCFEEPEVFRFPWSQKYTAREYVGFMKTGNGYLYADERTRKAAEDKVMEIIGKNGGSIERKYLCTLFLAKKKVMQ